MGQKILRVLCDAGLGTPPLGLLAWTPARRQEEPRGARLAGESVLGAGPLLRPVRFPFHFDIS